jgi:hypothetical protein
MLELFYEKAPPSLRGHALHFVGRSLQTADEAVPTEIIERLIVLWERRLADARASGSAASYAPELEAFGWWFASGKFDDEWALPQLAEALTYSGSAEVDHLVVERLAGLAAIKPAQVIRCLSLMVEGDKEGWRIPGWLEHARTILINALNSGDAAAGQAATNLAHRFGARGYLHFRDLVSESPT